MMIKIRVKEALNAQQVLLAILDNNSDIIIQEIILSRINFGILNKGDDNMRCPFKDRYRSHVYILSTSISKTFSKNFSLRWKIGWKETTPVLKGTRRIPSFTTDMSSAEVIEKLKQIFDVQYDVLL